MLLDPYRFATSGPPALGWHRFDATGVEQGFVVPDGATQATCYVFGAAGCPGIYESGVVSGAGGYTTGVFAVTEGETLRIRVGCGGGAPNRAASTGGVDYGGEGGWPGGGSGAYGDSFGGGGGGYSGIFRADGTPVAIAGGGGGAAGYLRSGGAGGGTAGQNASGSSPATGGTQTSGGTGTYPGAQYQGGSALGGNRTTYTTHDAGGGGGGYYGGAASGADARGGSGGSGYTGGLISGATYAGNLAALPAEAPAAVNGETVAPRGSGATSIGRAVSAACPPGNDGVIWLFVE